MRREVPVCRLPPRVGSQEQAIARRSNQRQRKQFRWHGQGERGLVDRLATQDGIGSEACQSQRRDGGQAAGSRNGRELATLKPDEIHDNWAEGRRAAGEKSTAAAATTQRRQWTRDGTAHQPRRRDAPSEGQRGQDEDSVRRNGSTGRAGTMRPGRATTAWMTTGAAKRSDMACASGTLLRGTSVGLEKQPRWWETGVCRLPLKSVAARPSRSTCRLLGGCQMLAMMVSSDM